MKYINNPFNLCPNLLPSLLSNLLPSFPTTPNLVKQVVDVVPETRIVADGNYNPVLELPQRVFLNVSLLVRKFEAVDLN
jgi:hypothetical protein